ncbi:MAG: hypothetical protein AB7T59_12175 [Hyphomonadaceae bacterium]
MVSIAPPKTIDPPPAPAPAQASESVPAAKTEPRLDEHEAVLRPDLESHRLRVDLDINAGRFVQVLTDVNTAETLRRYPSESQLAYSRAVMAYLRAQIGK